MEISLKRNYGFELIFKAENVTVCEDIEERIYAKTEDGKTDYQNVKRDISTDSLQQVASLLEDMIYYRLAEFDSISLIEQLINKLPKGMSESLITKLNKDYDMVE
jgi:flagellar hook-length control protein FliK